MGQQAVAEAKPSTEGEAIRKPKVEVSKALPGVWAMLRPKRGLLLFGLLLIIINRLTGFALPLSTKALIDYVIGKHMIYLLLPIVGALLLATLVQAVTAFTLSQLLSKAAWRLITDLRIQVQEHIGRLPISYYDANRTGVLVSRIMSDVEGMRNLVGTGLVEFVGGVLTACLTFFALLYMSVKLTLIVFTVLIIFVVMMKWFFARCHLCRGNRPAHGVARRRAGGQVVSRRGA
jgi:ABC-type bacteriocin/lantibiotic exporter with double-glycine peptidase domain